MLARILAVTVALATVSMVAPVVAAADTTPPKLKKADMVDSNANGRVDSIVITYSEAVNHPLDSDGTYPFAVAGYTVTTVQAASASKTLTITVTEKAKADLTAKPRITYTRTTSQPVSDLAGNQAAGQSWSFTFPARGVYVSTSGSDLNAGTQAAPMQTIQAGVSRATATAAHTVFVSTGTYDEGSGVAGASGVSITGGFAAATWFRAPAAQKTAWSGSPQALLLDGDTAVTIAYATLEGKGAGGSAYGVRAINGSSVTLQNDTLQADLGADGIAGSTPSGSAALGGPGLAGDPGVENSTFLCKTHSQPHGGVGGTVTGAPGAAGGRGGVPGLGGNSGQPGNPTPAGTAGGSGTPTGLGNWNPTSTFLGADGLAGASGSNGSAGSSAFSVSGYVPTDPTSGGAGSPGAGGGGGGGGGGGTVDCDSYGGGGGGGGAGGGGGLGATAGTSGGGSFALYLWASGAVIRASNLVTLGGGAGGAGAAGQPGGAGGLCGWGGDSGNPDAGNPYGGVSEQDDGSNGGRGGHGGAGGDGGASGGGAGGPSIGILIGGSSTATVTSGTYVLGAGGAGGASPGSGGSSGAQAQTLTVP